MLPFQNSPPGGQKMGSREEEVSDIFGAGSAGAASRPGSAVSRGLPGPLPARGCLGDWLRGSPLSCKRGKPNTGR